MTKIKKTLQIRETPKKNPNYWFNSYQEKGEIYSIPDATTTHLDGWKFLKQAADYHQVKIINCSLESKITYFNKEKLDLSKKHL